jgi:LacI family transcriptional regulator
MRIEDIAREAGVSPATVSRVLNRPNLVKKATRDRVLAVIDTNDYIPDSLARGLMNKRSGTIGVLIISISNAYYMEITEAIQRCLREANLMMILGATDDSPALEKRYMLDFASRRVDGIIVIDASPENFASGFYAKEAAKRPVVFVHSNEAMRGSGLREVFLDQRLGMRKAMEHLWGLGHRDIAFLRGRHGFSYDLKEKAWAEWLRERGVVPRPELVLRVDEPNTEEAIPLAENAVIEAIRAGIVSSAIFCCNDLQARGAMSAAMKLGLRIPEDISVMSHDDTILALSGRVQLSAVDLKMRQVGQAATALLLKALRGESSAEGPTYIEPEIEVRDSTAKVQTPSSSLSGKCLVERTDSHAS